MDSSPSSRGAQIFLQNCAHLVGVAILYWDHLITLDAEIHHLWGSRKSMSAYWFYLNRYVGFFAGIPVAVLPFLPLSTQDCSRYNLVRQGALVLMQSIATTIMVIRVYALWGRNRRVLIFLVALGACVVGTGLYSLTGQKIDRQQSLGGCHFQLSQTTAYRIASGWEALFVLDSVIFGMTIYNAHATRQRAPPLNMNDVRFNPESSLSLHQVLIRDGAQYFGLVALANLANISTYYFAAYLLPGTFATFANAITVTMTSRLILNLHAHAHPGLLSEPTLLLLQHQQNQNQNHNNNNNDIRLKSLPQFSRPEFSVAGSTRVQEEREGERERERDIFEWPAPRGTKMV
ncbi:hypothetical protein C8R46DRAFT_1357579 [Mycena filopes]|nr:hypothetical protein C8R46DRAFT_1357579 [Mycena filopes]